MTKTTTNNKKLIQDLELALQELKAIHSSRAAMLDNITDKKKKIKEQVTEIVNK